MSPGDLMGMAREALAAHKIRKRLTVAAVSVGVCSVLLLTSLGQSARNYVVNQFAGIGTNLLIVIPGKVETSGGPPMAGGTTRDLTIEDAMALYRQIPRVVDMAPISVGISLAKREGRSRSVMMIGATPEFLAIRKINLRAGMNLPAIDPSQTAQVCLMGTKLKDELFGEENALGEILRLGDYRFRVIGLMAPEGRSLGQNIDDMVILPVANVMRMVNRKGLFRILLQVRNFEEMEAAKKDVRRLLTDRHEDEDFTLITQQSVLDSLSEIIGMLTMALTAIAAISLAVAGIGIMNVMLVSVAERTSEIGLMKAVGASSGQVLAVFVAEAVALSFAGGVVGVLVGVLGAQAVGSLVPDFPISTPIWAVEAALFVALTVGVVFGALPAAKAARVPPVQALRGRA